jgi:hypothetical protein
MMASLAPPQHRHTVCQRCSLGLRRAPRHRREPRGAAGHGHLHRCDGRGRRRVVARDSPHRPQRAVRVMMSTTSIRAKRRRDGAAQVVDTTTRTAHYESSTVSGTGCILIRRPVQARWARSPSRTARAGRCRPGWLIDGDGAPHHRPRRHARRHSPGGGAVIERQPESKRA